MSPEQTQPTQHQPGRSLFLSFDELGQPSHQDGGGEKYGGVLNPALRGARSGGLSRLPDRFALAAADTGSKERSAGQSRGEEQ